MNESYSILSVTIYELNIISVLKIRLKLPVFEMFLLSLILFEILIYKWWKVSIVFYHLPSSGIRVHFPCYVF